MGGGVGGGVEDGRGWGSIKKKLPGHISELYGLGLPNLVYGFIH